MGWAVGEDQGRQRHIGYGVPATCDHPGCGASIDRGIGYACGGGVTSRVENCGLFFCGDHLTWAQDSELCGRCAVGAEPFEPTPDTAEWIRHVLADGSWAQWRTDNPEWTRRMRGQLPISSDEWEPSGLDEFIPDPALLAPPADSSVRATDPPTPPAVS